MSKYDQKACPRVDIGGQAVMEGVMMRSPDASAVAVRRPDRSIIVKYMRTEPLAKKHPWMGWPVVRGAVSMATMLVSGMKTLQDSTTMGGILEEEPTKFERWLSEKTGKGIDKIIIGVAVVAAVIMSMGLFVAIPAGVESVARSAGMSPLGYTLLGGIVKIGILLGYMALVGRVPEIRRVFRYHGAEHKTVYCHEAGLPLTPENARPFTTLHPRCGTAFLLIVFTVSILLFLVLNVVLPISNFFLRFFMHLLMLPLVAGVSYELLKGLAHSESPIAKVLRWPGLQLQRLTTAEPDDGMLECAIVAMNAALYGLPKHAPRTREGWAVLRSYAESDPAYVPPRIREVDELFAWADGDAGVTEEPAVPEETGEAAEAAETPEETVLPEEEAQG